MCGPAEPAPPSRLPPHGWRKRSAGNAGLPPLAGLGGMTDATSSCPRRCTYGQLIAGFQVANPPSGFSTHA